MGVLEVLFQVMRKIPMTDPPYVPSPHSAIGKINSRESYFIYWAEIFSSTLSTVLAITSMLVLSIPSLEVYF